MKVPCIYTFKGKKKLVDKLTTILQEMKFKLLSDITLYIGLEYK